MKKPEGVVSLCNYRRQRAVETCTEELTEILQGLHRRAIEVHNEIIERAQLSVLTELCRSCGVVLDLVDAELQASVLTPAALYGNSGQRVFGKAPVQHWVIRQLDCPKAVQVMSALREAHFQVWDYEPCPQQNCGQARPWAGPQRQEAQPVAGLISRCERASSQAGAYCGWSISFAGQTFILFAHRLSEAQIRAVRALLDAQEDLADQSFWRRIELRLLQAIIDPDGRHQQVLPNGLRRGLRLPPSRRGLLLSIRRALWRQFAEPSQGLTIHAHIAALVDDDEARAAFLDEVIEIIEVVTIKSGGLPMGAPSITVDEVLQPFYTDHQGRLWCRADLTARPLGHLLLDRAILEQIDLDAAQPIEAALRWAEENPQDKTARHIDCAWMTYRIEQNLVATYGLCPGKEVPDPPKELDFAGRSPVLPNMRVLFDDRFMNQPLSALPLNAADRGRLEIGLATRGADLDHFRLADIPGDERKLERYDGINHQTCEALRRALLKFAMNWRS